MTAIPKRALEKRMRSLTETEIAELEMATGRGARASRAGGPLTSGITATLQLAGFELMTLGSLP